jgi:hypothetical protein
MKPELGAVVRFQDVRRRVPSTISCKPPGTRMALKEMKSIEKKRMEIKDRVSRLRELSSDIASFEAHQERMAP